MADSTPAGPGRRFWSKRIALGCGGTVLALALLAGGVALTVKKATAAPEKVVHEFLAAAASGDYDRAHSYFAAPLKEEQPLAQFREAASSHPSLFTARDTTFNERSIDTSSARLSGSLTLASGTRLPASFRLVRENGSWKLIGYQIGS